MKHAVAGIICILLIFSFSPSQGQDTLDCETYISRVVSSVDGLQMRLESFAYSPSAVISDFMAYVDRRRQWEDIEPPDCAKDIHQDVISLFANVADAGAFAMTLKFDFAPSRERYFEESVERIAVYQAGLAESLSEISGNEITFEVDLEEAFNSILKHIRDAQ